MKLSSVSILQFKDIYKCLKCPHFHLRWRISTVSSLLCFFLYLGGRKTDGQTTGTCEVYNPVTDTWTKAGLLRSPRAGHATTPVGRDLFCSGGSHKGDICSNIWYDKSIKHTGLRTAYKNSSLPVTCYFHVIQPLLTIFFTIHIPGASVFYLGLIIFMPYSRM